eukprot:6740558-Heterocapsa_arctica.AAC.1
MNQEGGPLHTLTNTNDRDDEGNHDNAPRQDNIHQEKTTGGHCCVDGSCLVSMYPTGQQMICEIRKGDKLLAHNGTGATVLCMIQATGFRGDIRLVHRLGGCRITAGHPVRINTITAGHRAC